MCVCVYIYVCMCIHPCVYVYMYNHILYLKHYVCMCTYLCVYVYVCNHACAHAHMKYLKIPAQVAACNGVLRLQSAFPTSACAYMIMITYDISHYHPTRPSLWNMSSCEWNMSSSSSNKTDDNVKYKGVWHLESTSQASACV